MIIYPAIDVLDGKVVRLAKGEFDAVTEYGDDPLAVAESFRAAGADWLHLVDLSGARDGARRQGDVVGAIAATGLNIQTGGGVRSARDVADILQAGAARVVVGSLAVDDPQTVRAWLRDFGAEAITAAFDVRVEDAIAYPVSAGWTARSMRTLAELLEDYRQGGLKHALVTDIARDGMLEGSNLSLYSDLAKARPDLAWQASGGVARLSDLAALKVAGVHGAIVGKALYEGRFSLEDALSAVA